MDPITAAFVSIIQSIAAVNPWAAVAAAEALLLVAGLKVWKADLKEHADELKACDAKHEKEIAEQRQRIEQLLEKRYVEAQDTARMVSAGTDASLRLAQSNEKRTDALEVVKTAVEAVLGELKAGNERWTSRLDRVERLLEQDARSTRRGGGGA